MPAQRTFDQAHIEDSPFVSQDQKIIRTMAKYGAGLVPFGRVKAGTPLGKITATGKYRPCFSSRADHTQTSATVKVDDATNVFVGDLVDLVSIGKAGTKTFNANATPETLTITGVNKDGLAHSVQLLASTGNDKLLSTTCTITAGVYAIQVISATGGAGAITSTPADVAGILNAEYGHILAATYSATTQPVAAIAAQALAGGIATGAKLLTAEAVTVVDKTSAQHTFTTGTSVTPQVGDTAMLNNGAETAVGLLDLDANTYTGSVDDDNALVAYEPSVGLVLGGIVTESLLPVPLSVAQKADLAQIKLI